MGIARLANCSCIEYIISSIEIYYGTQRKKIQMLAYIGRGQGNIKRHMELLQKEPDNIENLIYLIMAYYQEK